MKNYFYLALVAVACSAMLSGCKANEPKNENEPQCWEATSSFTMNGQTFSSTVYLWTSKNDMEKTKSAFLQVNEGASYSYKQAAADDENSCLAKNNGGSGDNGGNGDNGENNMKCWEVTQTYPNGSSLTFYVWTTEQMSINLYPAEDKSNGAKNTYKEADAKDQDSCLSKNQM